MMMAHTGIPENLKTGPHTECAATATELENIMVNSHKEKCAPKKFYKKCRSTTNT